MIDKDKINEIIETTINYFVKHNPSMYEYFYAHAFIIKSIIGSFPSNDIDKKELTEHLVNYILNKEASIDDFIETLEEIFFTQEKFGHLPRHPETH